MREGPLQNRRQEDAHARIAKHLADGGLYPKDGLVDRRAQVNPPVFQARVLGHRGKLGILPLQILLLPGGVAQLKGERCRP